MPQGEGGFFSAIRTDQISDLNWPAYHFQIDWRLLGNLGKL